MIRSMLLSRRWFKTAYMAFLLIHIIPMVNHWRFSDGFLLTFGLWGVALLAADLHKRGVASFRGRAFVPLLAFYVLCGVSHLINYENALLNSLVRLGVFFLCGAVLYITGSDDRRLLEQEVLSVGFCFVTVTGLMALASVTMYVAQFQYTFTGPLDETIRIGVWENRLFGLFSSSNVGGSLMAIALLFDAGLLAFLHQQDRLTLWRRRVLLLAGVFHLWYIALSLSRGTMVSLLAAAVVLFSLYAHRHRDGVWRRAGAFLVAVAMFYCLQAGARQFSLTVVKYLDGQGLVENGVTGFDRVEFDDTDGEATDISNKRFSIWMSSLRLMQHKTLFGTGRNYYEYRNHRSDLYWLTPQDDIYLTWSRGNTHNGYLQILVDNGVLALAAYLVFLLWCLVANVRAYRRAMPAQRQVLAFCIAVVVYVLVNNLFETNMALMSTNPIQAMFWFVLGVDMTLCHRINSGNTEAML